MSLQIFRTQPSWQALVRPFFGILTTQTPFNSGTDVQSLLLINPANTKTNKRWSGWFGPVRKTIGFSSSHIASHTFFEELSTTASTAKIIFGHNNLTLNSPILDMIFLGILGTNYGTQKWPAVKKPTNRLNGNQHLRNMTFHEILLQQLPAVSGETRPIFSCRAGSMAKFKQILRRLALNCCLSWLLTLIFQNVYSVYTSKDC